MNVDRAVLAFAGFVVLVSLDLGYYVSPWFFLLVVFAGANMIQGLVHKILPGGAGLQGARLEAGLGIPLRQPVRRSRSPMQIAASSSFDS